jgi:small subunit ribosomal protein S8e
MDQFHGRSLTNPRGGRRIRARDKRAYEVGGYFAAPKVSEEKKKDTKRKRGGTTKIKLKNVTHANVEKEKGKFTKSKILKVLTSPDNRNYSRQGLVTKGATINTELGEAIVTNRPSQDGVVNAKLKE